MMRQSSSCIVVHVSHDNIDMLCLLSAVVSFTDIFIVSDFKVKPLR